jgi:hypothetical protein
MQEITETRNDTNTGSTGWVLSVGIACEAVIEETAPLGVRNPRGDDLYAFMLTVMADGRTPYRIRVPDGDDRELAIDWEPALAQLSGEHLA